MNTIVLYLITPSGNDGRSSAVRFTLLPGGPEAACHAVAVELPGPVRLEPDAEGTALVRIVDGKVYRYSAAEVFGLARHNLGGFRIADGACLRSGAVARA